MISNISDRTYEIRLFDRPLLEFEWTDGFFGSEVKVLDFDDSAYHLMPCGLGLSGNLVERWLEGRALPTNRRYADKVCVALGVPQGDLETVYHVGMGLSLNDSYWVVPKGFDGRFSDFNLFENGFSIPLSVIAYTGEAVRPGSEHGLTPELTTDGSLAKAWRIGEDGVRLLYKAGTPGWEPGEPVSEVLASNIATSLEMDAVSYSLSEWKDKPCSVCPCFCTPEVSYVPFAVATGLTDMVGVLWFCKEAGVLDQLCDMLAFDALICNTDRHLTNFGFLRESRTGLILGLAPVFDNGRGLFPNVNAPTSSELLAQTPYVRPALGAFTFEENIARFMGKNQVALYRKAAEGVADAVLSEHGPLGAAVAQFVRERAADLASTPIQDRTELVEALDLAMQKRQLDRGDNRFRISPVGERGGNDVAASIDLRQSANDIITSAQESAQLYREDGVPAGSCYHPGIER